jgi:hypothetical protein
MPFSGKVSIEKETATLLEKELEVKSSTVSGTVYGYKQLERAAV